MRRLLAVALVLGSVSLSVLPAAAMERPGRHGIAPGFSEMRAHRPGWHKPHRHHRPGVGLESRDRPVTVVFQQVLLQAPAYPPAFTGPTVLDLPVQLGIREAKPVEPAVIVLNGEKAPSFTAVRLSSGPRIIEAEEFGSAGPERPAFGARIIHLNVPVGGAT